MTHLFKTFFVLCLFSGLSFAQNIPLYRLVDNEKIVVFRNDSIFDFDLNTSQLMNGKALEKPQEFNLLNHQMLINNGVFFIENVGGRVYILQDNEIRRIDNSFSHKMSLDSNLFVHNDTIFRFGGYGYWSSNNKLSYFDQSTKEWEIVNSNDGSQPQGSFASFSYLKNYKVYIFGGKKIEYINQNKAVENKDIWEFDFQKRVWTNKGILSINIIDNGLDFVLNNKIYTKQYDQLYEIELVNNQITKNEINSIFKKVRSQNPPVRIGNRLIIFLENKSSYDVLIRNIDELNFKVLSKQRLYNNQKWIFNLLSILITLIIFLTGMKTILKYRRKRRLLSLRKNNLYYHGHIVNLNSLQLQLLKTLIKNEFEMDNEKVLSLVENQSLDRSQNIRNKNQLINELNIKLKTILNIKKDVLILVQDRKDRRMKKLILNRNHFYIK